MEISIDTNRGGTLYKKSKKTRKHAVDQESDQEKNEKKDRKHALHKESEKEKKMKKRQRSRKERDLFYFPLQIRTMLHVLQT